MYNASLLADVLILTCAHIIHEFGTSVVIVGVSEVNIVITCRLDR